MTEKSKLSYNKPPIIVSACLLGESVRYDGKHKKAGTWLNAILAWVDIQGVCPEVGAGLSVPRPPVELVKKESSIFALGRNSPQQDITQQLKHYAKNWHNTHIADGYIVKSRSPSCGFGTTPIHNHQAEKTPQYTHGLFTSALLEKEPTPVIADENWFENEKRTAEFLFIVYLKFYLRHKKIDRQFNQHYQLMQQHLTTRNPFSDLCTTIHNQYPSHFPFWPL